VFVLRFLFVFYGVYFFIRLYCCMSICQSVTKCIVALRDGVGVESCTVVPITSSDTCFRMYR